jgi:hypothetical protein
MTFSGYTGFPTSKACNHIMTETLTKVTLNTLKNVFCFTNSVN